MPKLSKIQTSFLSGEVSKQVYGHVDNPRYEAGLIYCQNYLPLVQGPLLRRPGTKFVTYTKPVASKLLPVLIPFQFSGNQNYVLEMGDGYVRFYQNEGQVVTNTNCFQVSGRYSQAGNVNAFQFGFYGVRSSASQNQSELIYASSVVPAGSVLELYSPYHGQDVGNIKFAQKQDTLYLAHPAYPPYKIVRTGLNTWDMKQIAFQDGPYLPLNSYQTVADNAAVYLQTAGYISPEYNLPGFASSFSPITGSSCAIIQTGPIYNIVGGSIISSTQVQVYTSASTAFLAGQSVFVAGVNGIANINNISAASSTPYPFFYPWANNTQSSVFLAQWTIGTVVSGTSFILQSQNPVFSGSTITNTTGTVQPALFQLLAASSGINYWADITQASSYTFAQYSTNQNCLRPMGLWIENNVNIVRNYGWISYVQNAATCYFSAAQGQGIPTGSSLYWNLGVYNYLNGFPNTVGFHQDRLAFAGSPAYPQEIDASMTSDYELFSATGSTATVSANNALQFSLNSQDLNSIQWILSAPLGLLAGTVSGEWAIAPSTQGAALSPTNISAVQVASFGAANAQALFVANAGIYIQRAQRKVRELLYYWQVGNYRSTNLSESSQHITVPSITKLVNQKEPHAFVWALRSDGALVAISYSRDDVTLQANAGWSRHILGGRSDPSGTQALVNSMAVIPSADLTYDQLWVVTQRYLANGSTMGCVEFMTKPFDDYSAQEHSHHLDCGFEFNSSIVVTGMTVAGSCVVTAPNHGLANSSIVRFYNTVGMNITYTDINGNVNSSNPFNEMTFVVSSVSTNQFFVRDFLGNYINTNSCAVYVGSAVVNQLITQISGLGWLAGETIGVLADGGIVANTTVSPLGILNLTNPAAIVHGGYTYNSDAQMLRTKDGSAQGTSIGSTRRVHKVAFMLHNVGDFSFGPSFMKLIPMEIGPTSDNDMANVAPTLFDGIYREGYESEPGFDDTVCWRQNSGLPGMVQAVTRFLEENDI